MVRNFTTALVAALVLGSAGIASARAPSIEYYDVWTYPQNEEPYCHGRYSVKRLPNLTPYWSAPLELDSFMRRF